MSTRLNATIPKMTPLVSPPSTSVTMREVRNGSITPQSEVILTKVLIGRDDGRRVIGHNFADV